MSMFFKSADFLSYLVKDFLYTGTEEYPRHEILGEERTLIIHEDFFSLLSSLLQLCYGVLI